MRILLTADPELPVPPRLYGGIERIVARLVRELRARGHVVGLVAHPDSTEPADVFFPWPGARSQNRLDALRNTWALHRAIRRFDPDVIHSFSRLAYLLPQLLSRRPKIMSYQREPGLAQTIRAARWSRGTLTFTGCSDYLAARGRRGAGRWLGIPNFADTDLLRPCLATPPEAPLVFLSRLDRVKGPDLAIAIARHAGRPLILAGNRAESGPDRDYFEQSIAPLIDGEQVRWIGPVDDIGKQNVLAAASAMLVPIQWDEPFGIVFAEALACGTPVISCPRGALPEIVTHDENGFLINSLEEGVAAVARLPSISRATCRASVENRYSPAVIVSAYENLYRELAPHA